MPDNNANIDEIINNFPAGYSRCGSRASRFASICMQPWIIIDKRGPATLLFLNLPHRYPINCTPPFASICIHFKSRFAMKNRRGKGKKKISRDVARNNGGSLTLWRLNLFKVYYVARITKRQWRSRKKGVHLKYYTNEYIAISKKAFESTFLEERFNLDRKDWKKYRKIRE